MCVTGVVLLSHLKSSHHLKQASSLVSIIKLNDEVNTVYPNKQIISLCKNISNSMKKIDVEWISQLMVTAQAPVSE